MAATRPYFLVFKGETFIIDAPQAAHAVQHVVGADVSELRPARAAEVSAWVRAGKSIPVAGDKAAVAAGETAVKDAIADGVIAQSGETVGFDRDGFDAHDATAWLIEQDGYSGSAMACDAWGGVIVSERMTLEQFDIIRTAAPSFGEALTHTLDLEAVRARLEDEPAPLASVLEQIGEAKRRELYVEDPAEEHVEERYVGDTGHLDDGR